VLAAAEEGLDILSGDADVEVANAKRGAEVDVWFSGLGGRGRASAPLRLQQPEGGAFFERICFVYSLGGRGPFSKDLFP
jgi:hypothetical protein